LRIAHEAELVEVEVKVGVATSKKRNFNKGEDFGKM